MSKVDSIRRLMAQRLLEELTRRNAHLEEELKSCRELYHNLKSENDLERPGHRRAFMLKAQVFQLERQCMLLSHAQASRTRMLTEIEAELVKLIEDFQKILASDSAGSKVSIERRQVTTMISTMQKLKNSLYRHCTLESPDSLRVPSLMTGSKYTKSGPISCLDVCGGSIKHLNLKHVGHLENSLAELYGNLCQLRLRLGHTAARDSKNPSESRGLTDSTLAKLSMDSTYSHAANLISKCTSSLENCCDELVCLSLLHPQVPCRVRDAVEFETIKEERVLQMFPTAVQKRIEVASCVRQVCKAHRHVTHYHRLKEIAAESQVAYYQRVQQLHLEYVSSLFSAITKAYEKCEEEILHTVKLPISTVLRAWTRLKSDQSAQNMKAFLEVFKQHEDDLQNLSELGSSRNHGKESGRVLCDLQQSLSKQLDDLSKKHHDSVQRMSEEIAEHAKGMQLDIPK